MKTLFFVNDYKNDKVYGYAWKVEHPIGNIILIPGMADALERYDEFASFLNQAGYDVYGIDHYGQGTNVLDDLSNLGVWKKRAFTSYMSLIDNLVESLRVTVLPTMIIGHSMGSFFAQRYIQKYSHVEKVVMLGSSTPSIIFHLKLFMSRLVVNRHNRYKPNKFLYHLLAPFSRGIKKPKTDYDWLSYDEENVKDYISNKRYGFIPSGLFFKELFRALTKIGRKRYQNGVDKKMTIGIFSGQDDPVGHYGKGPTKLYWLYRKLGLKNVELKLYDQMRHEVLHETKRKEVFQDIVNFLKQPVGPRVVIHANYGGTYEGNFIPNITEIGKAVLKNGGKVSFMIPAFQKNATWLPKLQQQGAIYFYEKSVRSNWRIIKHLVTKELATIFYTNFITSKTQLPLLWATIRYKIQVFVARRALAKKRFLYTRFARFLYVKKLNYIAVSKTVRSNFLDIFHKEATVIIDRVSYERLKNPKHIPLGTSTINILTVGWNYYVKGFDVLINAVKMLVDAGIKVTLNIASHDPNAILVTLRKNLNTEEIPSFINLLPPTDHIEDYYYSADLVVFASRSEGFCYAMVEAAMVGAPIIANDIPTFKELNIDNRIFYETNNPESLKEKMMDAIKDLSRVKEQALMNKDQVIKEYATKDIGAEYYRAFTK
ncbi:MAG: alpha/beta fold hydrolase [Erysipelotrichaceae bacterium]|jgi:alpha-beta hydrolase superfamily lysophospholipase|nr:alpha/beta fold hydrolase [Erysipelotrichaceae bacterium]